MEHTDIPQDPSADALLADEMTRLLTDYRRHEDDASSYLQAAETVDETDEDYDDPLDADQHQAAAARARPARPRRGDGAGRAGDAAGLPGWGRLMAGEMGRREPTRDEQQRMREQLLELGWQWARTLADLGYDDPPWSAYDGDPDLQRDSTAARASALRHLATVLDQALRDDTHHTGEPALDGPTAWWTRDDVVDYLADAGAPLAADTWSGYVARGQAPTPGRHLGRTPLWDPAKVRAWQAARRGRGWRGRSGNYDPPWLSTAIAAQTAEFYTADGRRLVLHHPDVPALPEHVMGDIAAATQNAGSTGDSWAVNSYARYTRWSWPAGHGGDPNTIAAAAIPVARQLADAHGWTVEIDPGRSSRDDRP